VYKVLWHHNFSDVTTAVILKLRQNLWKYEKKKKFFIIHIKSSIFEQLFINIPDIEFQDQDDA
jgi:hypothetical protein